MDFPFFCFLHEVCLSCSDYIMLYFLAICKGKVTTPDTSEKSPCKALKMQYSLCCYCLAHQSLLVTKHSAALYSFLASFENVSSQRKTLEFLDISRQIYCKTYSFPSKHDINFKLLYSHYCDAFEYKTYLIRSCTKNTWNC